MIIPFLLTLLVLVFIVSIILLNRIKTNLRHIESELKACELASIMQDESEEDAQITFSINNLINQTLKERNQ